MFDSALDGLIDVLHPLDSFQYFGIIDNRIAHVFSDLVGVASIHKLNLLYALDMLEDVDVSQYPFVSWKVDGRHLVYAFLVA